MRARFAGYRVRNRASARIGPVRYAGRVFRFRRTYQTKMSNEEIARQIVARLLAFRTAAPFGRTWEAFATAEILLALNAASRSPRDHRRPVARREPYESKG
jgi:hypothetical protein